MNWPERLEGELGITDRNERWDRDVEWLGIDTTPDGYAATASGLFVPASLAKEPPPVALDLFAGCGGFSLGIGYAGFDVVAAVEWDIHCFITYATNLGSARGGAVAYSKGMKEKLDREIAKQQKKRKRASGIELDRVIGDPFWWGWNRHSLSFPVKDGGCRAFFLGDIRECSGEMLCEIAGVERFDVIVGGPPCQGLSTANSKACIQDSRNAMLWEYLRMVEELRPRAFVIENVPQLLTAAKGGLFREMRKRIIGLGYTVVADVINAVHYGVPQHRRRTIIVGTLDGETVSRFQFPMPTHWAMGDGPDIEAWDMLQRGDDGEQTVEFDEATQAWKDVDKPDDDDDEPEDGGQMSLL